MSKDENKTYTKEERREFFRQAEQQHFEKTYGEMPPLDKSFMKAEKSNAKSSKRKRYSFIAVAAVAMISIVSVAQPLIGSNEAYGDKGILHRLYDSVMGIGTDEQDGNDRERESRVEIYDLDDIDEAKDLCENLYVPEYLPEGFELEKLVVERHSFGVDADYTFKNGENELSIGMIFMEGDNGTFISNNQGEIIELEDRIIVPAKDKAVIEIYTEDGTIMICGDIPQEEMIKIAKEIVRS